MTGEQELAMFIRGSVVMREMIVAHFTQLVMDTPEDQALVKMMRGVVLHWSDWLDDYLVAMSTADKAEPLRRLLADLDASDVRRTGAVGRSPEAQAVERLIERHKDRP